jgi:hypothetical protein
MLSLGGLQNNNIHNLLLSTQTKTNFHCKVQHMLLFVVA